MLISLADLITMATFLSITPSVKESFNNASARKEKRGKVQLFIPICDGVMFKRSGCFS